MARPNNLKKLEADIPSGLHDELNDWISHHKDVKMRQCARAMTEMFLSLPEDLQAKLLICKRGSLAFNSAYRFLNDSEQTKTIELSLVAQEILREFDGFVESDIINAALVSLYKCTLAERMDCFRGGIGHFDKDKYDAGITKKDIAAELKDYHAAQTDENVAVSNISKNKYNPISLRQALRNIVEKTKAEQPFEGELIKINPSEEGMLKKLTQFLGPEAKKETGKKKKKRVI